MKFRVARLDAPSCGAQCPAVVIAEGVIEAETPSAFVEFARTSAVPLGVRSVVFINSPGGNVLASMELGTAFRRLHVAAIVAGYATSGALSGPVAGECVSACVYALMGAVRRVAPTMSQIALHRMSVVESDATAQGGVSRRFARPSMVALLARYAARMGVDPALVFRAESLPPDHIEVLSARQMRRWRLAASRF